MIGTVQVVAQDVPGSIVDGPFVCRQSYNPANKTFLPYDLSAQAFPNRWRAETAHTVFAGPTKRPARSAQRNESYPHDGLDASLANKTKRRKKESTAAHAQTKVQRGALTPPSRQFKSCVNLNAISDSVTTTSDIVGPEPETPAGQLLCNSVDNLPGKSIANTRCEKERKDVNDKGSTRHRLADFPSTVKATLIDIDCAVTEHAGDDYLHSSIVPQKNQHRVGPDYQVIGIDALILTRINPVNGRLSKPRLNSSFRRYRVRKSTQSASSLLTLPSAKTTCGGSRFLSTHRVRTSRPIATLAGSSRSCSSLLRLSLVLDCFANSKRMSWT